MTEAERWGKKRLNPNKALVLTVSCVEVAKRDVVGSL